VSILAALGRRLEKAVAARPVTSDASAGVVVCECNAWKGFMIQVMRPKATRIKLRPGLSGERVLAAFPTTTRTVVMHIDASLTTDFLSDEAAFRSGLSERGIATFNVRATDIRKRTIHRQCAALGIASARAEREGPPEERVIIKSTLNAGGTPERKLVRQWGPAGIRFAEELSGDVLNSFGYRVCRRAEVPDAAWADPALVVERFAENPEGCFFRVYVVGPASVVSQAWTDREIKKLSMPLRARENYYFWTSAGTHTAMGRRTDAALQAVRVVRCLGDALKLNLYATDCVMDAGGTIMPVDVNKTPYWGRLDWTEILEHLQHGFDHVVTTAAG
jgi:hypothetical protein